ncbi:glycoside hydrolase family 99-like domain-containing protein [Flavobacterium sp. ASV13]|uniref:glycosyltransferase WbsX family protein n=1 Tax=Flavobacterium sp. ASV13 TaxID=1506583 RepID=UPI00054FA2DC|nr:glycoside hydrolase family 99-like domain-containing protein [Flavobacterium sp. ASV13]
MKNFEIKPIAIYLPQFHPIPENDEWWGKGFTEWTNVTKARPLFKEHYQPHLPTDLGFYDLRLEESRLAQEALAKEHGIYGFCYYHYWFNGKRLLHEPLDRKMKNPKEDFPFMLCWANETWSRRWLGEEKEILIEQTYSEEDDLKHISWLIEIFKDSRYIKVNERPVFVFYRPSYLPDVKKTIALFRNECLKNGLKNPYLVASNSHLRTNYHDLGFDDILNFQPKLGLLPNAFIDKKSLKKWFANLVKGVFSSTLKIYDYNKAKEKMKVTFNYKYIPCSFVGWDNTARRGRKGIILKDQNVETFIKEVEENINDVKSQNRDDENQFVFINAWNEWAEGNHLEPDNKNGLAYLKALKNLFDKYAEN